MDLYQRLSIDRRPEDRPADAVRTMETKAQETPDDCQYLAFSSVVAP